MKKTKVLVASISIIILSIITVSTVKANYFDSDLVKVWNSRKDLQKVYPGDPYNNTKLESWCQKYGWKEYDSLFNCYPDKGIVEKIVINLYDDRISQLEAKINELTNKINSLSSTPVASPIVNTVIQNPEGHWRNCRMTNFSGGETFDVLYCDKDSNDSEIYVEDDGVNIKTNWHSMSIWVK